MVQNSTSKAVSFAYVGVLLLVARCSVSLRFVMMAVTKEVAMMSHETSTDALASAFGSTSANMQMYSNTAALLVGVIQSALQVDVKSLKPESVAQIARLMLERAATATDHATDPGVPFKPPVCSVLLVRARL